jgi:hypothetical protein
MCGRFSVNNNVSLIMSELINMHFNAERNINLSPSQSSC